MGFFRNAAGWLGLVDQAWVRVRGPGVEIVISGDKRRVNQLLECVHRELARILREPGITPKAPIEGQSSAVVPREFDDKDSPYVVSGRMLRPRPRLASGSRRNFRPRGLTVDPKDLRSLRGPRPPAMQDADTEQVYEGVLLEITEQ